MKNAKTVSNYIDKHADWKEELKLLREILLASKLDETVKWGAPVYALGKKNVVGIGAFKAYAGLWFFQGALLSDPKKKLVNAQEGVTKALRQWRFSSADEIRASVETIKLYLEEAISNQEQGKEIKPAKKKPLIIPDELQDLLHSDAQLRESFEAFSLSKKREFTDYISEAKRAETKQRRLEKIAPMILEGIGLGDKYRK